MDVLHDSGRRTWVQIGTKHAELIPDYVMEHSLPDEKEASSLPNELFADSHRRFFPIDCPASTWLSAAYFSKNAVAGALPYSSTESEHIKHILLKAANVYEIEADAVKISEAIVSADLSPEPTEAEINDSYGWVMKDAESGAVVARKYPMFDSRGVEKAAAYFEEYRSHYPQDVRKGIARQIMRKAGSFGMDVDGLPSAVRCEAGFGIPQRVVVMDEILRRSRLTKDAEASMALANVNNMLSEFSVDELSSNLDKLAELLDDFDTSAGLTPYYGTELRMPADFLFEVALKEAEAVVDDSVSLSKYVFSVEKLASLEPSVFAGVLGADVARDLSTDDKLDQQKLADVLPTLPRPDKTALEEHLIALFHQ